MLNLPRPRHWALSSPDTSLGAWVRNLCIEHWLMHWILSALWPSQSVKIIGIPLKAELPLFSFGPRALPSLPYVEGEGDTASKRDLHHWDGCHKWHLMPERMSSGWAMIAAPLHCGWSDLSQECLYLYSEGEFRIWVHEKPKYSNFNVTGGIPTLGKSPIERTHSLWTDLKKKLWGRGDYIWWKNRFG